MSGIRDGLWGWMHGMREDDDLGMMMADDVNDGAVSAAAAVGRASE